MSKLQVFTSREEWLEARKNTVGASTLAHWIVERTLQTPPPQIPQIQSAIQYGSIWEPYIVMAWAKLNKYTIGGKNKNIEDIPHRTVVWYDNSFYQYDNIHVSPDAIARDNDGNLFTIEVKTGGKPEFSLLAENQQKVYHVQASIESLLIAGNHNPIILYSPRPENWENKEPKDIEQWIDNHITTVEGFYDISEEYLHEEANKYQEAERQQETPNTTSEGIELLSRYLSAKAFYDSAKQQLDDYLQNYPTPLRYDGYVAQIKVSKRTTTDWKQAAKDYGIDTGKYSKTSETMRLSIVKEKQ